MAKLWECLIKAERLLEDAKAKTRDAHLNLQDCYARIDREKEGKATALDFQLYMRKCGYDGLTEQEIGCLVGRFERKQRGCIGYYDFVDEILPRMH